MFAQFGAPPSGFPGEGDQFPGRPGEFPGGEGFGQGGPEGAPFGSSFNFEGRAGFNFGEAFDPTASDIGGGGAHLVNLKIYNRLVKALYKTQDKFKVACVQEGGEESLVSEIKSIYENNLSEITDICRRYEERAANFSEDICDPTKSLTSFPAPRFLKQAAEEVGVTFGFNMTASDMEKVCIAVAQKEMSKQQEFMEKRFRQDAQRFLDGCQQRKESEEKMRQREEEMRRQNEERMNQGQYGYGPPQGGFPQQGQYPNQGPYYPPQGDYHPPKNYPQEPFRPPEQFNQPSFCGDGICNEDPQTCSPDCGNIAPPPQEPTQQYTEPPPYTEPSPSPEPAPSGETTTPTEGGLRGERRYFYNILGLQENENFNPDFNPEFDPTRNGFGYNREFGPNFEDQGFDPFGPQGGQPYGGPGFGPSGSGEYPGRPGEFPGG
ncbi:MAG: hypothetical protein HYW50_01980, partial [Candidatus Diapherotrites archaeon]|nr:hypothetical protein [Candidatus Diapherotrites archaeon]